jgi:hypothetical protein
VVDAFDIEPGTTVSHWQDTNPGLQYSGAWSKSSTAYNFSGSGVSNLPELPVTAQETQAAGAAVTVPFRGIAINWIGYRGPDAGIARSGSTAARRARSTCIRRSRPSNRSCSRPPGSRIRIMH